VEQTKREGRKKNKKKKIKERKTRSDLQRGDLLYLVLRLFYYADRLEVSILNIRGRQVGLLGRRVGMVSRYWVILRTRMNPRRIREYPRIEIFGAVVLAYQASIGDLAAHLAASVVPVNIAIGLT